MHSNRKILLPGTARVNLLTPEDSTRTTYLVYPLRPSNLNPLVIHDYVSQEMQYFLSRRTSKRGTIDVNYYRQERSNYRAVWVIP